MTLKRQKIFIFWRYYLKYLLKFCYMFCRNNQNFLGIVFPSRTMYYNGGCTFSVEHCALKRIGGCTKWEGRQHIASGCDYGQPCGPRREHCVTKRENRGKWGSRFRFRFRSSGSLEFRFASCASAERGGKWKSVPARPLLSRAR